MRMQDVVAGRGGDSPPIDLPPARALRALRSGEIAFVCRVTVEPRLAKRLADLGFIGGTRVEMIRPGRPCIVRINGTRVGLGRRFQEQVFVESPGPD